MAVIQVKVPNWLDTIFAWPVMVYRLWKYGYAYRRIYLGEGRFTIVEPRDFYWLNYFHWTLDGKGKNIYAVRNFIPAVGKIRTARMHREIMNFPEGLLVDHRNLNSLDNRRANLRLATKAQNMQNRGKRKNTASRFIGVTLDKSAGKWNVRIKSDGKKIYLGRFDNEIDAARAYDEAARKYHKDFARLNFPQES
ncbi:MAG: AP2 domain-containing protein [Sedimentisphaerales bacterium]|jgi:hypothetical protein